MTYVNHTVAAQRIHWIYVRVSLLTININYFDTLCEYHAIHLDTTRYVLDTHLDTVDTVPVDTVSTVDTWIPGQTWIRSNMGSVSLSGSSGIHYVSVKYPLRIVTCITRWRPPYHAGIGWYQHVSDASF